MAMNSKKRKFLATSLTATMVAAAVAPAAGFAAEAEKPFPDVELGTPYTDPITKLAEAGVIKGYADGTFKIRGKVTRAEAATMFTNIRDLDTKVEAAPFADVKQGVWYSDAINAAYAEGVISGNPDGTFNPNGNLTRAQFARMVVDAYGLDIKTDVELPFTDVKEDAWYTKYIKTLYANDLIAGKTPTTFAPGENIDRGDFARLLAATDVQYGHKLKEEAVAPEVVSVSAINAKTLEVKFNTAVDTDKAKFEVKRGTIKPTVKETKFSEDKKSATIEFSTAMAAGDYTVSVTGLTEEALTETVKVEAEKLTKINFLTDVAVISGTDVTTNVTAENQYGEDVTSKLNTTTYTNIKGTTSKGTGVTIDKDGKLTVTNSSAFSVDDKVVVTVVDSVTGVSATKTLTVAQAAKVESIVLGELKTDDEELAKKTVNVANMTSDAAKYYVPVTIKDQYGNTLKAADLVGVTVVSSNDSIVKPHATAFKDTKNGTVIQLDTPTATATHGTAVLTVVAAGSGKTANTTIVVKENAKLDTVTLEAPSTVLKDSVATELPVSITNSYGEEVALKDVTVVPNGGNTELTLDTNTKISAIGATLKVEQDYVNKKAVLKVTPSQKNVTITVVTATGKSQVLNLTADDQPEVAGIKGLDKDFVSLLANDASLSTNLKDAVKFVDQYGEDIAAPNYDAADTAPALDFTIKEKDALNTVTGFTPATGVIAASTTAGTEDYEIILKDAAGKVLDTLDVTVSVVDADKLTQFGINDLNKFYTDVAGAATHTQTVAVHGLHNGKKVAVNQNMIKDVYASAGLEGFAGRTFTPSNIVTDGKDVASTLTVLVANKDNTYTLTKDVVYNDAAPVAQSLVAKYDGVEVKGGAIQVPHAQLKDKFIVPHATLASKLQFVAKDQYGVQRDSADYNVVVTNNTTVTPGATFTTAGEGKEFIAADAGKSLQLNVRIDGILQTLKVIVE